MNRLKIWVGATLIVASNSHCIAKENKELPNIILIVADDLGYADMSFLPQSPREVHTPQIDRLARNGLYFQNAYATASVSSPARAGLITGRYQQRWGNYWFGHGGLPDREVTIPEYLSQLGYFNVKIGKTHMNGVGDADHPLRHGFHEFFGFLDHTHSYIHLSHKDIERIGGEKNAKLAHYGPITHNYSTIDYDDENAYTTDLFTDKAVQYIRHTKTQPLFMFLSYNAVHHPTYENIDKYNRPYGIKNQEPWNPQTESYNEYHNKKGLRGEADPSRRLRYLACLDALDKGIGKVLDAANKKRNILIIFMSDNGGTYNTDACNTPLSGHKFQLKEGGIRIPLIISWKGQIQAGVNTEDIVSALDIMPTVLEVSGFNQQLVREIDGQSLLPTIKKEKSNTNRTLIWDTNWGWAVRKGDWKLVVVKKNRQAEPAGTALYNLKEDIREEVDLKEKEVEKVKELTEIYSKWKQNKPGPLTPQDAQRFEAKI
ncbi:sulfatase family protein [Bacteroides neonati]|uniref:sulfatase family protein n=1 Tax=Bacteroides neonati TaxID=1347393 RepID=UPI0004B2C804|nr:sulfatase-like hydrolase/transferase [Bacteroides neonati]MCP3893284.1 sulfatase-like hydrolase/transferase [Bacteroides sp.]